MADLDTLAAMVASLQAELAKLRGDMLAAKVPVPTPETLDALHVAMTGSHLPSTSPRPDLSWKLRYARLMADSPNLRAMMGMLYEDVVRRGFDFSMARTIVVQIAIDAGLNHTEGFQQFSDDIGTRIQEVWRAQRTVDQVFDSGVFPSGPPRF